MSKLRSSPDRHKSALRRFLDHQLKSGLTPDNDTHTADMVDFYENVQIKKKDREMNNDWQKNNLEFDLRTSDWIAEKVKSSNYYSQNLYAALCNNSFKKIQFSNTEENTLMVLKGVPNWSCSWRYAGGIIADIREEGDYMNWYCSGTQSVYEEKDSVGRQAVDEGYITDEIQDDLAKLGWAAIDDSDD